MSDDGIEMDPENYLANGQYLKKVKGFTFIFRFHRLLQAFSQAVEVYYIPRPFDMSNIIVQTLCIQALSDLVSLYIYTALSA